MENRGKEIVSKYRQDICQFYINQLGKSHHEILKAACRVMKEFTSVEGSIEVIIPNLGQICPLLLKLTTHENPEVRLYAFIAIEKIVMKCPNEMKTFLPDLIDAGFFQLTFNFQALDNAQEVAKFLATIRNIYNEVNKIFPLI